MSSYFALWRTILHVPFSPLPLQNIVYSLSYVQRTLCHCERSVAIAGNGHRIIKPTQDTCTCVEKKAHTSKRVSIIACNNVISKAQCAPRQHKMTYGTFAAQRHWTHKSCPVRCDNTDARPYRVRDGMSFEIPLHRARRYIAHTLRQAQRQIKRVALFVQRTLWYYNAVTLPGDCHATLAMTQYFVRNITKYCLPKSTRKLYALSLCYPVQRT